MSEPDRIRRLSLVGRVLLVATGVLLSLALAEIAVRAQVGSRPVSFHIVNAVFGQYDEQFGQRFRPNSKKILSLVSNGRVVWCPGVVASANDDGLGGRRTLAGGREGDDVVFPASGSVTYRERAAPALAAVVP